MENRSKILLLTGSLNQGGAEFQILSLAKLLLYKEHDIELLALTDYTYYLPFVKENHIRYSSITKDGSNVRRLIRVIRQILHKKPDLVISYVKRVSQIAILAKVFSGFRFKLIISERTSVIRPWHDLYYFNLAVLSDWVIVNSISKYNYIRNRFQLIRNRTIFIPNIIDVERYSSVQHIKPVDGQVRLTYVGRVSPEKNLLNLIKAIRIVSDNGFKVTLSIIGEAHNEKYLEELNLLVEGLVLSGIVRYEGPVIDITDVYKRTDLLCLVSIFEGFSNVLSEAISCGIPVVASNIPENRYLVEENKNGFLVDPRDPGNIATGIIQFVRLSSSDIETISRNNREKSRELFNQENIYTSYRKLFELLLGHKKN